MDWKLILIGVAVVVVIAGLLGGLLALADKIFYVPTDERLERVNELLPQINCGACGFPGCQGLAEALVKGEQKEVNCLPIKKENKEKIVAILKEEK